MTYIKYQNDSKMIKKPTIQRKPKKSDQIISDKAVDAFLQNSAVTAESDPTPTNEKRPVGRPKKNSLPRLVSIRVPEPLLERIDTHLETDEIGMTRNAWILRAIQDKLKNDRD